MKNKNSISETEYLIMKFLWSLDHNATASEVREHFSNKNWSKQTVSTFLKRLTQAGFLKMIKISPIKFCYKILISENEYNILPVREVVKKSFKGSYSDLFCALVDQDEKLSDSEIDKIRELLNNL